MFYLNKERRETLYSTGVSLRTLFRHIMHEMKAEAGKKSSLFLCKVLYFFFFGTLASYAPFVPIFISAVGASQVEIGVISAVRPFISFISMPAVGLAADKLGRHKLVLLILIAVSSIMRLGLLGCTTLLAVGLLVIASDFFASPVGSIIDSTVLDALPDPSQYGKQRLWGTIGWGACAPLAGLIISKAGNSSALWIHAAGSLLVLFLVSQFKVHTPPTEGTIWSVWRVVFKDARTFCFFLGTIVMGQAYGAIGAFLFVRLKEIGGSALLMGLTLFVNCIVEAPMFHISEAVIKRLGLIGVLQLCLGLMCVRLAFYGLMENPWPVLIVEGIHGITFALLWTAGTTHFRKIGPDGMGATMQGFYTGVKYGIGTGSGSLMAGALAHSYSLSFMFLTMSAYMAAASVLVLLLRLAGILDAAAVDRLAGEGPSTTVYVQFDQAVEGDCGSDSSQCPLEKAPEQGGEALTESGRRDEAGR